MGCKRPADRLIHPSAWKVNAPKLNVCFAEFSEVRIAPVQHKEDCFYFKERKKIERELHPRSSDTAYNDRSRQGKGKGSDEDSKR